MIHYSKAVGILWTVSFCNTQRSMVLFRLFRSIGNIPFSFQCYINIWYKISSKWVKCFQWYDNWRLTLEPTFLKSENYLPCIFGSFHRKCNYPHTKCLMLCGLNLGNERMIYISHRRFHSKRALIKDILLEFYIIKELYNKYVI